MGPSTEVDDDSVFGYVDGRACADELSEPGPGASILDAVSDPFGESAVVLLAATSIRMALGGCAGRVVAQYDLLKPQDRFQVDLAATDRREICTCQDHDHLDVF